MIETLEALAALHRYGTLAVAGAYLRISPSALWKRIRNLEESVGKTLLRRQGRRLYLTPEGIAVLGEAEPHLKALRELAAVVPRAASNSLLRLGLTDSLAAAFGGMLIETAESRGFSVALTVHRGPLLLEKLREGEIGAALLTGPESGFSDLVCEPLGREEILEIGPRNATRVLEIERSSLTGRFAAGGKKSERSEEIGSFSAALGLALAGAARARVPAGLARRFGAKEARSLHPRRYRQLLLVVRKNFANTPAGAGLLEASRKLKLGDSVTKS